MKRTAALFALLLACGDDGATDGKVDAATEADASTEADAARAQTDASAANMDASPGDANVAPSTDAAPGSSGDAGARGVRLPPDNAGLDYQLGGAYTPAMGVGIVSRDRTAKPAPGLYNVCYVNGFQAQENEAKDWLANHPTLVLRDDKGNPVIDKDWNEMLLDVGSAEKRTQLLAVVGAWIDGCANSGFDAVEIDNLDSYSRSGGRLKEADAIAFIALLSTRAHADGLAIAQKNSSELAKRRSELGTDFAVSEECSRYDECDAYTEAYGTHVLMIEYRRMDFEKGCKAYGSYPIVLRDQPLAPMGGKGYVFEDC